MSAFCWVFLGIWRWLGPLWPEFIYNLSWK